MSPARSNSRSALDRLRVTTIATPLAVIALIAPWDAALAQSHIATLPVKHPGAIDGAKRVPGMKPVVAKQEREAKSPEMRERCDEHGGCSGLILSVGAPTLLRPVSLPVGTKPMIASGGIWIDASDGNWIGRGTARSGTDAGSTGGTSGGSTPANSPNKPSAMTDPGHGAPSKRNGPAGGTSPTDNGGAINE